MSNKAFNSLIQLKDHKESFKLSSKDIFIEYLSKIFTNLLQREETATHSKPLKIPRYPIDIRHKNELLALINNASFVNSQNHQKSKLVARGISLKSFLDYMDIQEFITQRIFKYLNKSKSNKLNKNDFCQGLNDLYYGEVENLIKFTFFLADFNRDGMIYKSDMKLFLAYIPAATEFSQKLKLKQIDSIIDIFFDEKISKNEKDEEKEINYDTYYRYVLEYINNENKNSLKNNSELLNENYNNNAPFFYFISILSYLFKNCPFNPKNVDYFQYFKKKQKLKLLRNEGRSLSQRKISTISKIDLNYNKINFEKTSNKLDSRLIGISTIEPKKLNKCIIDADLSKIEKKDLFKSKRSNSQIANKNNKKSFTLRSKLNKKPQNKMHDYIIVKQKEEKIISQNNNSKEKKSIYKKINKNKSITKKVLSPYNEHTISTKASLSLINNTSQSPLLNMTSVSPGLFQNSKACNNIIFNSNENSDKNLNIKKKKSLILLKEKMLPLSVGAKFKKEEKSDLDELSEFILCEPSREDNYNNHNKKNSKDEEDNEACSNEIFLYKFNEDDFLNKLNKYYAMLSDKEILFFDSELKKELCDLWYINKTYISTNKEKINGTNYYVINITFNNNGINKLYFIDEKTCKKYSKIIKNSIKNLDFEEYYEKIEKLGQGHFGKVYKFKNKLTGQIYAVKIINKQETNEKDLELIRQEKNYLKLIKHPNIISLKDYFEDEKYIYFVTEYYNGGDIITLLEEKQKEKSKISEKMAAKIIRKITEGLKYLNFFGIIHRDIKPENIMFSQQNDFKSLKIIDLGVCQTLTYGELAREPIGTNGYICPEIYLHQSYSFKIDVWSLGIILYLLITGGILPFEDEKMDDKIIGKKVIYLQQEYPEKYFGNKSKALITLLDKMLEKNADKRINIKELIKDNWFDILKK